VNQAEVNEDKPLQADHIRRVIKQFGGPTKMCKILGVGRTTCYAWLLVIPGDHALKLYLHAKRYKMGVKLEDLKPELFDPNWTPTFNDSNN
jgi:hypothetical protein